MSIVSIKKFGNLLGVENANLTKYLLIKKMGIVSLFFLPMLFGCSKDSDLDTVPLSTNEGAITELRSCSERALGNSTGTTYIWNIEPNYKVIVNIHYIKRSGENSPVIFWQITDYYFEYNGTKYSQNSGDFKRNFLHLEYKKPCGNVIKIQNNRDEVRMPFGVDYGWTTLVPGNNVTNKGLSDYKVLIRIKGRKTSGEYVNSPVFSFNPST